MVPSPRVPALPLHSKHHRETVKYEPSYKDKYTYPDNDGKDGGEGAGDDGSDPVATLCVAGKDVTVSGQPLNKQCPPPPNPNPANCEPIPNTCPNPAPTCSPTSCAPRCPAGQWTRFAVRRCCCCCVWCQHAAPARNAVASTCHISQASRALNTTNVEILLWIWGWSLPNKQTHIDTQTNQI